MTPWPRGEELLLCSRRCCSQLRKLGAEKSSSEPWFWPSGWARGAGWALFSLFLGWGRCHTAKGSVCAFLAGCGASASGCFEKRGAFHRLWNVGLLDGSFPVQVISMALLYVLKRVSGCGLSFPCPNPNSACQAENFTPWTSLCWMFEKAENVRLTFWGFSFLREGRFLYNPRHESIQRDAFFCTS